MNLAVLLVFMLNTPLRILSFRPFIVLHGFTRHFSYSHSSNIPIILNKKLFTTQSISRKMSSNFTVTPEEEELFTTLRRVVKDENLGTVIRVAGGWVRDRLLGYKGKNDIDLALDNMLGSQLADVLVSWNEKQGLPALHYHVVQLNPEKSKHLETATMKLGKFDVDFVNLRSESYSDDSRIPLMKFGTPLEDALRRDLTINSLFYNINTQQVEDITGKGIQDLGDGIIRTPLPAMQTLLDDPLRAFRAVRFASRFHFRVDPDLRDAIRHPDVRSKLQHKVSRERISQEILQMLSHPEASTEAAVLLHQMDLLPLVLKVPFEESDQIITPSDRQMTPDCKSSGSGESSIASAGDLLTPDLYHIKGLNLYLLMKLFLKEQAGAAAASGGSHTRLVYGDDFDSMEANSILRYAALMDHGRDVVYRYLLHQKKKPTFRPMLLTNYICMHELFIGKKSADTVCLLQQGADSLHKLLRGLDPADPLQRGTAAEGGVEIPLFGPFDRVSLGLQLREWGAEFPSILLLACAKASLESFMKLVEDSTLVGALDAEAEGAQGAVPSRHAEATHLVQAFLQSQLQSGGGERGSTEKWVPVPEDQCASSTAAQQGAVLGEWLADSLAAGARRGGVVLDAVSALGLEEEWRRPLLLSGKELKEVLTRIPNGPIFNQVLARQTQYELCYPNTSKSDLSEYLKSQFHDFV